MCSPSPVPWPPRLANRSKSRSRSSRGHTGAVVAHGDLDLVADLPGGDPDRAAAVGDRVGHQVVDDLGQPVRVDHRPHARRASSPSTTASGWAMRSRWSTGVSTSARSCSARSRSRVACCSREVVSRSPSSRWSRAELVCSPESSSLRSSSSSLSQFSREQPARHAQHAHRGAQLVGGHGEEARLLVGRRGQLGVGSLEPLVGLGQGVGVLALLLEQLHPLGVVAGDLREADVLTVLVEDRRDRDVRPEPAAVLADPPALLLVDAIRSAPARARARDGGRPAAPRGRRPGSAGR